MPHMPSYGQATAVTANGRILGLYLYVATGTEASLFTINHNLRLAAPYLVTVSPQGARSVPVIDPNPTGSTQTTNTCQVAISAPLTVSDRYLFTFYTVPS